MGIFDKIKSAIAFDDEDDDDSIYEAEMRELERKERSKAQKKAAERRTAESDDEDDDDENPRKVRSFSDRKRNSGSSTRTRSYSSDRNSQRRTGDSSRLTPPRSPEGSYSSRRGAQQTRQRAEVSNVSRSRKDSSEISIVKVKDFTDAQEVCDNLINGKPIIVCFDEPNSASSQRIMDFIAGCVYTINGNLHTISNNIFLFSPDGVDVSGDYLNMVQRSGFGVPTFNKMF